MVGGQSREIECFKNIRLLCLNVKNSFPSVVAFLLYHCICGIVTIEAGMPLPQVLWSRCESFLDSVDN